MDLCLGSGRAAGGGEDRVASAKRSRSERSSGGQAAKRSRTPPPRSHVERLETARPLVVDTAGLPESRAASAGSGDGVTWARVLGVGVLPEDPSQFRGAATATPRGHVERLETAAVLDARSLVLDTAGLPESRAASAGSGDGVTWARERLGGGGGDDDPALDAATRLVLLSRKVEALRVEILDAADDLLAAQDVLHDVLSKVEWAREHQSGDDLELWTASVTRIMANARRDRFDREILEHVDENGPRDWPSLARHLGVDRFFLTRRWYVDLAPHIVLQDWTAEEDARLPRRRF